MGDQDDPYITQLQALFMSCDPRGVGLLGHCQLQDLCHQLQLDPSQAKYVIDQLVGQDPFVKVTYFLYFRFPSYILFQVDFDEFKEIFVKLLTMDHGAIEERGESRDVTLVREYLRSTWTKLGLPEDGHLTLEDLRFVCSEIGMVDVSEEAVEQLFATLDRDGDGRVSLEELLSGMSSQHELLSLKRDKTDPQVGRSDRSFSTSLNFLISLHDPSKDG